ncbi:type VI secretion system protein IglI family protein [Hyalangium versicolor]|uniref:type VI secretion system protein IglI family protein n=1 Tax=Hyalangium versicolor TaxID=2861190 RepID=UPI001CCCAE75|nr:type VI secretion system protein IglI family protein [Hyalangium versicolor]
MGEPAKVIAPLELHLLDQLLEAEAPDMDGSDERLGKVNDLVAKSAYLDAARAAEALLKEGEHDVRLVGPYLLGVFLEGGMAAMPVVYHSLSSMLLRNWQFFSPRERRDVYADGGLRWLIKVLNKHLEHHERMKDATFLAWSAPSNREPLEQALALSEEIFASFSRVMPRNGCEAPFRRLTQWLEGHLQSLPVPPPPEDAAAPDPEEEPEEDDSSEEEARPAAPVSAGPTIPVSPALADLMRKLAAFNTLVERGDMVKASVVAADVLALIERFDPRVYLPSLFSRFFSGLSTHAEQVEPLLQSTESLSFRALDQLYRVDLSAFLEQSAQLGEAED